jgi:hypothetical protein
MNSTNTNKKGDLAKAIATGTLTKLGYRVGFMLTESAPYDLLVDTITDGIKRVSVKYLGSKNGVLDLRNIHTNGKGWVIRKTKENDYDWLYVYKNNGSEYLYKECLVERTAITPKDKDLIKINDNFAN